jgi:hypothetical protein
VTPNEEELARYSREAAEQKVVYQSFSTATLSWPSLKCPLKVKLAALLV